MSKCSEIHPIKKSLLVKKKIVNIDRARVLGNWQRFQNRAIKIPEKEAAYWMNVGCAKKDSDNFKQVGEPSVKRHEQKLWVINAKWYWIVNNKLLLFLAMRIVLDFCRCTIPCSYSSSYGLQTDCSNLGNSVRMRLWRLHKYRSSAKVCLDLTSAWFIHAWFIHLHDWINVLFEIN